MEKSKLGISVGLLAAGMYFLGMVSLLALIVVAGYVLLKEDNAWLKRSAVKASAIAIVFALLGLISPLLTGVISSLITLSSSYSTWPLGLSTLFNTVINLTQFLIMGLLGLRSLRQTEVKINKIDDLIDRHIA
ncbi:hypothetical protein [Saccharibacillus sacchari]|uniref:hypothetical protein n=1 Tax=Saccharibacillus sacchari TaxID=456493 RepID=UPI0004BBE3AA|nr:hypothetical protein [Saccharibacillus sacchari]